MTRAIKDVAKDSPTLSICIPSYNRAKQVLAQLIFLKSFIDSNKLASVIEVVVSNNKSTDETLEVLSSINFNSLRIITHDEHYDTAEENIFRSLNYLKGKYVWFLGDDDPINPETLINLLEDLNNNDYSCIIYNSMTIKNDGTSHVFAPIKSNSYFHDIKINSIISFVGILYTFAGISNVIIKRQLLNEKKGIEWLSISPIYSHVAWFIESLAGKTIRFYNASIVNYRQNDYSDGHWNRVAERKNVESLFFWSNGLVRLIDQLIKRDIISYRDISQAFEVSGSGVRYRLIDDIIFKTFQQIEIFYNKKDTRELYAQRDFKALIDFIISCDPSAYNITCLIQDAYATVLSEFNSKISSNSFEKFAERFHYLFNERQRKGQIIVRQISKISNWSVYKWLDCYLAVNSNASSDWSDFLDPIADGITIIKANSVEEIFSYCQKADIDSARIGHEAMKFVNCLNGYAPRVDNEINLSGVMGRNSDLQARTELAERENARLMEEIHSRDIALNSIKQSSSWRITAPIRMLMMQLYKIVRHK